MCVASRVGQDHMWGHIGQGFQVWRPHQGSAFAPGLTLGCLETLGWSLGGSPVPFKSCARLCFILLPSYRKQMGTGIWGTARISGSSTFVCVLRTAIQVLERDQKHRINQNISIILAKSQLKEFRAVMCTVSGCVGTGEPCGGNWVLQLALERQPGSPAQRPACAMEDAGPYCHCVRTTTVMLTCLLSFLSCSFCLTWTHRCRLQSPSGVHRQHVRSSDGTAGL